MVLLQEFNYTKKHSRFVFTSILFFWLSLFCFSNKTFTLAKTHKIKTKNENVFEIIKFNFPKILPLSRGAETQQVYSNIFKLTI